MTNTAEVGVITVQFAVAWEGSERPAGRNIGRFTDRAEGDSTKAYSQWCLERGLVDGWTFNDPRVRTHRQPSMSTPVALPLAMSPDTTNDAYIADIAINQLRTRDRSRPFFQVCSFNGPHPPFMIPEPYFSMYDPAEAREPPNFGPQPGEPVVNRNSYYRQLFLDHGPDFDAWRKSVAVYWGFTTLIDGQLGRLLGELAVQNAEHDTIVVFLSDHGENLGAHGLWHKMVAYDDSIRVPLIFRVPGQGAGARIDAPVGLLDVAPTLASLCGLPARNEWRGVDLFADPVPADRPMFALHRPLGDWMGTEPWRMIEVERVKYIRHLGGEEELFDLATDPFETRNLSDHSAWQTDKARLARILGETMRALGDPLVFAT